VLALQYGGLDRGPLRSSLVRPLPLRRVQRLSGLAILEHKPISPPSVPLCLCPPPPLDTPDIAQHSRSLTTHPDTPPPPASPAPTLQSARRAAKERAPRALVADRDSHCSLSAQERTASTETRAKRGRPTPYSSSCSGSQHSCFQPLTSNFTKRPCFHHPDSNPASSARAYPPEQHDRIAAVHRRPPPTSAQLPRRARINPCHLRAHRPDVQSRERKHPGANIRPAQIANASYSQGHGGGSSPAPQARE
jgi:hypothetical protein